MNTTTMRGIPRLTTSVLVRPLITPSIRSQSTSTSPFPVESSSSSSASSSSTSSSLTKPRRHVTLRDRRLENRRKILQNLSFNAGSTLTTEGSPPKNFRPSTKAGEPAPAIDDPSPDSLPAAPVVGPPRLKTSQIEYTVPPGEFEGFDQEVIAARRARSALSPKRGQLKRGALRPKRTPTQRIYQPQDQLPSDRQPRRPPKEAGKDSSGQESAKLPRRKWNDRRGGGQTSASQSKSETQPTKASPRKPLTDRMREADSTSHAFNSTQLVDKPLVLNLGPGEDIELHKGFLLHRSSSSTSTSHLTYPKLKELCDCPKCIHPTTRQRTNTSGEQFEMVKRSGLLDKTPTKDTVYLENGKLHVVWQDLDGPHLSVYTLKQLKSAVSPESDPEEYLKSLRRYYWDNGASIKSHSKLWTEYSDLYDERGELKTSALPILRQLYTAGIAIIKGVPSEVTDDKGCSLRKVAESIGDIRRTFYGETWDVRSVENSKNVAYTSLNLGLHMDLLYTQDPPRYQLLHCLRNRVEGGASYFVDTFSLAFRFQREHPEEYLLLCTRDLEYEYDNDGHYLHNRHTILPRSFRNVRAAVNWSPPFQRFQHTNNAQWIRDPTDVKQVAEAAQRDNRFYEAIALWETYLNDANRRYTFTMNEGDLVLFDNRRVLHARTAFRELTEEERKARGVEKVKEGESSRWLKGCYMDGDVIWDRLVSLGRPQA